MDAARALVAPGGAAQAEIVERVDFPEYQSVTDMPRAAESEAVRSGAASLDLC